MQRFLLLGLLSLFLLGGLGYWLVAQQLEVPPAPQAVVAVEDALATPEMFGLLHVNVEHIAAVQQMRLGAGDLDALFTPSDDEDSALNSLARAGFDSGEDLYHVIAAAYVTQGSLEGVAVLLGDFPVEALTRELQREHKVEETTLAGEPTHLVSTVDRDTCEVKGPFAMQIRQDRMVFGLPFTVEKILQRLASGAEPEQDLADWRAFRAGKVVTAALLEIPENVGDAVSNPFARMAARKAQGGLETLQQFYLGGSIRALPTAVSIVGEFHVSDEEWPKEAESTYQKWRETFVRDSAGQTPALDRLMRHFNVTAEQQHLRFGLSMGTNFVEDLKNVFSEGIRYAFSSSGLQASKSGDAPDKEQTLEPEKVAKFLPAVSHDDLQDFDPSQNFFYEEGAFSGPFAVKVNALRLWEKDADVREIELEATSGEIQNMGIDSMNGGKPRAELFVTEVRGTDGGDLLRDETCGKDRNQQGAELDPRENNKYVDGKWFAIPTVTGKKTVRLRDGARIKDVAGLSGYIRLWLPTSTEVKRIEAPFEERVFESDGVRVKFAAGAPTELKYDISGETGRVLKIRALNGSGEHLQGAGSSGSSRLVGQGRSVTQRYRGAPQAAELIIAREEAEKDYPFSFASVKMQGNSPSPAEEPVVTPVSRQDFAARFSSVNFETTCEEGEPEGRAGPFVICAGRVSRYLGSQLYARFKVLAPESALLEKSLSGVELALESVTVPDGDNMRKIPVAAAEFAELSGSSNRKHLEGHVTPMADFPEGADPEDFRGLQGKLVVRLPARLTKARLDLMELGNEALHADGWSATLVEISGLTYSLKLKGPRERLVQFVPYGDDGRRLSVSSSNLRETDEDTSEWLCQLSVRGTPKSVDIVFASAQERLQYDFDVGVAQ